MSRIKTLLAQLTAGWLAVTTAAAGVTSYQYDALGRLVQMTTASGSFQTYDYDNSGNRAGSIQGQYALYPGQTLLPGTELLSLDGAYSAVMQASDGNFVVYGPSGAIWTSNTEGHPGSYAQIQSNGQLTVYNNQGIVLWVSNNFEGNRVIMQTDGNLAVYDATGTFRWGSLNAFLSTNTTLSSAEEMVPGEQLISADGCFVARLQNSGDFQVIQTSTGSVLWQTNTTGQRSSFLVNQATDGNMVLYSGGQAVWLTGTQGNPGDYIVMQTDGNLVVYKSAAAGGSFLWASNTSGHTSSN